MHDRRNWTAPAAEKPGGAKEVPDFVPHIDTEEIFMELIAEELRHGRLTPARRRRIVRYAAGLGLTAVQAGRILETCRKKALRSRDPAERFHALRLVDPPQERISTRVKIALLIVGALLLDLLILIWLT